MNRTKWIKLYTWPFLVAVVIFVSIAVTDWLTEGFTTVGPFLG